MSLELRPKMKCITCYNCGIPIDHFIHKKNCITVGKNQYVNQIFDGNFKNMMTCEINESFTAVIIIKHNLNYKNVFMIHSEDLNNFKISILLELKKFKMFDCYVYLRVPAKYDEYNIKLEDYITNYDFTKIKNNCSYIEIDSYLSYNKYNQFNSSVYVRKLYDKLCVISKNGELIHF